MTEHGQTRDSVGPGDIDAFFRRIDETYRAGDAAAVRRLVTADVVISPIEMVDIVGSEKVEQLLSGFFNSARVIEYRLTPSEIEVHVNTAYVRGTCRWQAFVGGTQPVVVDGRFSAVLVRLSDGTWQLHRLLENALPGGANRPAG